MRLNGWQRIWTIIAAAWFPLAVWQFSANVSGSGPNAQDIAAGMAVGAAPLLLLHAQGLVIAWVRRGFMQLHSK